MDKFVSEGTVAICLADLVKETNKLRKQVAELTNIVHSIFLTLDRGRSYSSDYETENQLHTLLYNLEHPDG